MVVGADTVVVSTYNYIYVCVCMHVCALVCSTYSESTVVSSIVVRNFKGGEEEGL